MNRLTVVAIAGVAAVGSGLGLVSYVSGAEGRAAETVERVAVLVTTANLPAGAPFDDALAAETIVVAETLRSSLPPTAVSDATTLTGTVAGAALLEGQLVVDGTFIEPDADRRPGPPTFADGLPDGTVAVSFDVSGAAAVSDLIRPGNRVNLLVQVPNASELGLADSGGPAIVHVFQDLRVLAIGSSLVPTAAAPDAGAPPAPTGGSYTVAVDPRDAARVLFLTRQYEVFLVLVGPGTEPSSQAPIDAIDALPDRLTAEVPAGAGSS